ncbi:M14 family metallopeptidase [Robertkochia aurantiaca]|uniref:M14 family metallopeptidase n=1 Tax=Robertkochia aurantiaca TaxID=2873700 RepID=UPI001CCA9C71|nr:M14 metallopeptidase family protein [Robertkochia sp. 3YJGBD-33]
MTHTTYFEQGYENDFRHPKVYGRYLPSSEIYKALQIFDFLNPELQAQSVEDEPLYLYRIGSGERRILAWSQMHGNESTTTKALLDLLYFIRQNEAFRDYFESNISFYFIPVLNPDGANAYTRFNANGVDLNRDAKDLTQPESRFLRKALDLVNPQLCLNLHDQRTIFSAGSARKPATVSFLSPSVDPDRSVTEVRKQSMRLIALMREYLEKFIPGCVGRYDDAFNDNCVGDQFQSLGIPTILFEAGHFPGDYMRENTRKYVAMSLVRLLEGFIEIKSLQVPHTAYFSIPENEKRFYDLIITGYRFSEGEEVNLGIQLKEVKKNNNIIFRPELADFGSLNDKYGHSEVSSDLIRMESRAAAEITPDFLEEVFENNSMLLHRFR